MVFQDLHFQHKRCRILGIYYSKRLGLKRSVVMLVKNFISLWSALEFIIGKGMLGGSVVLTTVVMKSCI
jgi:hypothetical protein